MFSFRNGSLSVNLSPVANPNHQDGELSLEHLVDDPIAAHSKSAQAGKLPFQNPARVWGDAQSVYGFDQAQAVGSRDPPE